MSKITKRRAGIIRSAILYARAQAGPDGLGARVLSENIQDLWGRAYDRARYGRQPDARSESDDWADYFEAWGSEVGSPPFTQERVVAALRGPRPFGTASASKEEPS